MAYRLLFLVLFASSNSLEAQPNVLLICVDDLKPRLGCYGDVIAQTPNIDRLAQRGVIFDRAYCNQAVCAPSRHALLTGLRPDTLGIYDLATNFRKAAPKAVTLGQHFKNAGYHTASLGKIFHVGQGNIDDKESWSVPSFRSKKNGYQLPKNQELIAQRREAAIKKGLQGQELSRASRGPSTEKADVPDEAYPDGDVAVEAIKRLEQAKKNPEKPFFLAVGFLKPHLPFNAPKKYWDLYDAKKIVLPKRTTAPEGAPAYAPSGSGEIKAYTDVGPGPINFSEEKVRELNHAYLACVSYTDAQVGKLIEALDKHKLSENTIIVLWGDHGWHLGDHGFWCKHTNYEQAARIPLIIVDPRKKNCAGVRSAAFVETVDIYPTLAELCGLKPVKNIDGLSFARLFEEPKKSVFRPVAIHVYPRGKRIGRAVRHERYRLVEWKVPGEPTTSAEFELYDYESDPEETKNIAADHPEVVKQLQKFLAERPEARPQLRPKKK